MNFCNVDTNVFDDTNLFVGAYSWYKYIPVCPICLYQKKFRIVYNHEVEEYEWLITFKCNLWSSIQIGFSVLLALSRVVNI